MHNRCYGCMMPIPPGTVCGHCGYDNTKPSQPHQLPAGTVLQDQYLVGKVLGQGGFGITYLGWDRKLETRVAIKEYYPVSYVFRDCRESPEVRCAGDQARELFRHNRERFLQEARYLARLQDIPGIVEIRSLFQENNTAYMVMEYVEGVDLKTYLRRLGRTMRAQETFRLLGPVLYAMSKVHQAGLVHRDISPDNIMVRKDGTVKLLDFGAAKEVENPSVDRELANSTEAILKHGFAPLEQYQRRGRLGPWTDVYALCATVHYCVTGKVPNGAMERYMGNDNICWDTVPDLTPWQRRTLDRGLALLPENRIRDMGDLWQGLFAPQDTEAPEEITRKPEAVSSVQKTEDQKTDPIRPGGKIRILAAVLVLAALGLVWMGGRDRKAALSAPTETAPAAIQTETPPVTELPQIQETETQAEETQQTQPAAPEPAWKANVLMADPTLAEDSNRFWSEKPSRSLSEIYTFFSERPIPGSNIPRSRVTDVFFLNTRAGAPADAWDVSAAGEGSILAWTAKNTKASLDLYIAAEGEINGCNAARGLFYGFTELNTVHFDGNFHTEGVQDLSSMFAYCRRLNTVDIETLNTADAENMNGMFYGCEKLKELDLSNMDTANVRDMGGMFCGCGSLSYLDVTGFDTAQVTDMSYLFSGMAGLKSLDLSSFDTSRVTDMQYMFSGMTGMSEFSLATLDTAQVENMAGMFRGCSNEKMFSLDLSSFDTANVRDMSYMFADCLYLSGLDLSHFDTASVTDMQGMFSFCRRITSLDLRNFETGAVEYMNSMFDTCSLLKTLEVSQFDTGKVIDFSRMFYACGRLEVMDPTAWVPASMKKNDNMFFGCDNLPFSHKALGGEFIWSDDYGY